MGKLVPLSLSLSCPGGAFWGPGHRYSLALERLKSHRPGRLMSVRAERTWNYRHMD
jgi:hypothetical protein